LLVSDILVCHDKATASENGKKSNTERERDRERDKEIEKETLTHNSM